MSKPRGWELIMTATSFRFSEMFEYMMEMQGAECIYRELVTEGNMEAWEFRFWAGHRSLT